MVKRRRAAGIAVASLADRVEQITAPNVYLCYQCEKCSAGCPVADHMDLLPNQVMRAGQFNDARALEAKTPWVCVGS